MGRTPSRPVSKQPDQLPLNLPHRVSLGGDDFLVAPCNRDAVAWLDKWPDWPEGRLCLVGPKSSGKTHLVSVHRAWSNATAISARDLVSGNPEDLLGKQKALVFDDADRDLAPEAEQGLFHLMNSLRTEGGSLLMTAAKAPKRWAAVLPDLASRLAATAVAEIREADDEVLMALLVKQFHDRQLSVSSDIISYALGRIERTHEAAAALVAKVDNVSLAGKRKINLPLVREILHDQG